MRARENEPILESLANSSVLFLMKPGGLAAKHLAVGIIFRMNMEYFFGPQDFSVWAL